MKASPVLAEGCEGGLGCWGLSWDQEAADGLMGAFTEV